MIAYVGLILFQIPGCIGFRIFPPSKVRSRLTTSIPECKLTPSSGLLLAFAVGALYLCFSALPITKPVYWSVESFLELLRVYSELESSII